VIGDGILQIVDFQDGEENIQVEREATLIAVKKNSEWYISAVRIV
jgi:hypothetical protein